MKRLIKATNCNGQLLVPASFMCAIGVNRWTGIEIVQDGDTITLTRATCEECGSDRTFPSTKNKIFCDKCGAEVH